jgi:propionyl-CoA synthetase
MAGATDISYTIYTSGTTGKPKGVQRDVGGYAVALAASMKHIFLAEPGETYFSTSDIGWVVGHSYIVYGPLIAGMATIMYEGLPTRASTQARRRHLVEPGREVQGDGDVQRAHRGAGAQEAGPGAAEEIRPVEPEGAVPGRRAAGRADRALDQRRPGRAHHRQLLADRSGWPILTIANGVEKQGQQVRQPGRADVRLPTSRSCTSHRRGTHRAGTRRAWS